MDSPTFQISQPTNFVENLEYSTSSCQSTLTDSSSTSSSSVSSSDCQSRKRIFDEGLVIELAKGHRSYELISQKFLDSIGEKADVVAIHRRNWSEDLLGQAKVQSFRVYAKALENKHGGNPNVKFGWYGTNCSDKERIDKILSHGFSYKDLQMNDHGAILLSHVNSPISSVEDLDNDEDGLRHVLLCRVLLGRSELVHVGSGQTHPSSEEFDSGVDSYDNPKKYVVWSTNMNTHILPEYIVTFKVKALSSYEEVVSRMKNATRMPKSPWISFAALISVLGKKLGPHAISLINKCYKDYQDRRILRPELIQKVRQIAGDNMLIDVIRYFKGSKDFRMFGLLHHRNYNTNKYEGYKNLKERR